MSRAESEGGFLTFDEGATGIPCGARKLGSSCVDDPQAKQIESGAAMHGAFDEFQSMNLPFDRPVTPSQGESGGGKLLRRDIDV